MGDVKGPKVEEPTIPTVSKRKSYFEKPDWFKGYDKVIKGVEEVGEFIGTKLGFVQPFKDTKERIMGKAKGPAAKSLAVGNQDKEDTEEE